MQTVFFMAENSCSSISSHRNQVVDAPYIALRNVDKSYSGKGEDSAGIKGMTFDVPKGTITAIIGESGSGKSTLLRLIYGLIGPDQGDVMVDGLLVPKPEDRLIPGHDAMRMVSQGFDDLNTYAHVWDNVASRLSNTDLSAKREKTQAALHRLSITHLARQRVADLSGGEKQRVAIARALVTAPAILLMDEPFNQVDASFRDQLQQDILRIVRETGLTVILVSHDPSEVLSLAHQLVIIKAGKLQAIGNPADLYHLPPNEYVGRLLAKTNVLSDKEGPLLHATWKAGVVLVHPEWIDLREEPTGNDRFEIVHISFRGVYEELFLQHGAITLRAINHTLGRFAIGQHVKARVNRFVELAALQG